MQQYGLRFDLNQTAAEIFFLAFFCKWASCVASHSNCLAKEAPRANTALRGWRMVMRLPPKRMGEISMEGPPEQTSDTSAAQSASNEAIKLIRKLRWAGMDEEAERLLKELKMRRGAGVAAESVLPTRLETD
jgi:hypothetical protein